MTNAVVPAPMPASDIHAHPGLSAWLFGFDLAKRSRATGKFALRSNVCNFPALREGGVRLLWSALHVPERQLFADCPMARTAARLLSKPKRKLWKGDPTRNLIEMMDELERQVAGTSDFQVVRNNMELDACFAAGRSAIVHTIEGADALQGRVENLASFAERGVASLTLIHFYPNGICGHASGIPDDLLKKLRLICKLKLNPRPDEGLLPYGREVVEEMLRLRMIVDMSHCGPRARSEILALVNGRAPVVASHVGVTRFNDVPYNLRDEEIREIYRGKGVIGVIFMTEWLSARHPKNGLDVICDTIQQIAAVGGSYDGVAIGTDFDGFTDPPDDARDSAAIPRVAEQLLARGVARADVEKVLWDNSRRVLRDGWR